MVLIRYFFLIVLFGILVIGEENKKQVYKKHANRWPAAQFSGGGLLKKDF